MEYYKVSSKARVLTDENLTKLPKGFRFHPTDEEIVIHYLIPKALNSNFRAAPISQADFNKCEPWDLPKKQNMSDTERYYYCQRDRKYPSGVRTNRATKAGYWKATGKDKKVFKGVGIGRELIGMKKTLVFYTGRAPNGKKTNWVMHEFRLQQNCKFSSSPKDDGWVVSRVFHKISTTTVAGNNGHSSMEESDTFSTDELIVDNIESSSSSSSSLPDLVDTSAVIPLYSSNVSKSIASVCYRDRFDDDEVLIYSDDPDYYHPYSLSETLLETLDSFGNDNVNENKCGSGTAMSVFIKH